MADDAADFEPSAGRIDHASTSLTGGAEVFVYVPDGIDGAALLTEPILMVYGDEDFTAASAAELAETSKLGALAKRENSVIAFINSIGETWGEADADAYSTYAGALFAERDDQAGGGSWDPATNRYSNGKYSGYTGHRYYAIGEGAGADFVSNHLIDDTIDTAYGWGGRSVAIPAGVLLFNTTAVPRKGSVALEYPAVVVNGTQQVDDAYAALNTDPNHFVSLKSDVTDDFDHAALESQFGKLISVRRSNVGAGNTAIFDLPIYSDLGIEVVEKTVALGSADSLYLTYLTDSLRDAAEGTVPMVLALHGAGEKAEYFSLLSTWPEVGANEGFIVVSVDDHNDITNEQMEDLIDGVFEDYPQIDQSRVYLSGFSMGSMHSHNLGTQLTQRFAGMVPMNIMPAPSNTADLMIPTMYIGGQEDPYPGVFPSLTISQAGAVTVGAPNNADRMLDHLFAVNSIRGGEFTYDASASSSWWGIDFDHVESFPAATGKGRITVNSLKSEDGIVYTKLVNTSALGHNIFAEHIPLAWDFISQFKRNAEGSISMVVDEPSTPEPQPTPTVTVTASPSPQPTTTVTASPAPGRDLYETPGFHQSSGRQWMTVCEDYSSKVDRCWTYIWGTTVHEANGQFMQVNGWLFNNLTYIGGPRADWADNPLGHTGKWTGEDGREWRTDCDTANTGQGGCRTYATADVIQRVGGTYQWVNKEVFNNQVRFH